MSKLLAYPLRNHRTCWRTYRILTIHCLVAGDYLRPSKYTIETLTLHFAVNQNMNRDTYIGNWILIGVVIRIAMRMGLHRDPSHWAKYSTITGRTPATDLDHPIPDGFFYEHTSGTAAYHQRLSM